MTGRFVPLRAILDPADAISFGVAERSCGDWHPEAAGDAMRTELSGVTEQRSGANGGAVAFERMV
jgi:hypothetical protein